MLENTRPLQCVETVVDANAIVTDMLEGDAIPAVQCLPIIDDAVLDGDLDEHVRCMPSISRQDKRDAQLGDPAIATVRTLLAEELQQSQTGEVSAILRGADNLYFQQGVLFKKSTIAGQQVHMLAVPLSLRPLVYRGIHDEVGHLGSETVRLWLDQYSSDDDEVIFERPARTRPHAPPTEDEECSSDDEPLIRRLRLTLVHHESVERRLFPSGRQ